jgi:hypothetical protein
MEEVNPKNEAKDGTARGRNSIFTEEAAVSILEKVASGQYGMREICASENIAVSTLYHWLKQPTLLEFSKRFKEAQKRNRLSMADMAQSGLAKLCDIYEYDEETIEYKSMPVIIEYPDGRKETQYKPQIVGKKVTRKKIMPTIRAIEFVKTNIEPHLWKNMRNVDHTTGGKTLNDYSGKSTEELMARAKALQILEANEASDLEDDDD